MEHRCCSAPNKKYQPSSGQESPPVFLDGILGLDRSSFSHCHCVVFVISETMMKKRGIAESHQGLFGKNHQMLYHFCCSDLGL